MGDERSTKLEPGSLNAMCPSVPMPAKKSSIPPTFAISFSYWAHSSSVRPNDDDDSVSGNSDGNDKDERLRKLYASNRTEVLGVPVQNVNIFSWNINVVE